jgi:hypothetical protein
MTAHARTLRRWGTLLFLIGYLVGVWLMGGIAWAGLEASLFDTGTVGENLPGLRCSLLITPDESATVRVTLTNPLDRPITRLVRWRVAQRHLLLVEQEREGVPFQPGERKTLERQLSPELGVFGGRFIMTSVFVGSAYPLPALEGSCGTWVVHIPYLDGIHILILGSLIAVLGMGTGFAIRYRTRDPEKGSEGALGAILAFFVVGMAGVWLFGWWVVAGLGTLLMLLTLGLWVFQRIDERWLQVRPPIEE